ITAAVERAGVEPALIEDVILGCAMQQGSTGMNVARQASLRASLPVTVPGMTLDRQCSSGLMAIATAARQIVGEGMQVAVAGGVESISLVQNEKMNLFRGTDPWLKEHIPQIDMARRATADVVAERYHTSREAQDEYALQSQQRTAQAQQEGRFAAEIAPITTTMVVQDKQTGERSHREVTLQLDEGNRPG